MVSSFTLKLIVSALVVTLSTAVPANFFTSLIRKKEADDECLIDSICFAMDQSGSVLGFYAEEQKFVVKVAEEIAKRTDDTSYSAHGFAFYSNEIQSGTKDLKGTFIPKVNVPVVPDGGTNMYAGLEACFEEVKGDKGNRIIVLVTDGEDTETPQALDLAPQVKAEGVFIVTVGVTNNIDEEYLKKLASSKDFFVKSPSFDKLVSKAIVTVDKTCVAPEVEPAEPVTPTPLPDETCEEAYEACDFAFNGAMTVPTFDVTGTPDVPFTTRVVSKTPGECLGILNSNDREPEFILEDGSVVPITKAKGVTQNFSPTQFKPFHLEGTCGSGIGHETYQGNQGVVAQDKCIRVWFSSYQLLSGGNPPVVVGNVNLPPLENKCVVFRSA